jgi:chromosome segregation ATPase
MGTKRTVANTPDSLLAEIAELEREMERMRASAHDAESALAALEEQRAETAGRLQLARRAAADFEARITERRSALEEARVEAAAEALRDAVRRRDAVAERAAERLSAALEELHELDRVREEALASRQELLELANGRGPVDLPPEPEILRDRWNELAAHVRRGIDQQLEDELIDAAARSPMGAAIGDLPRHLQEAARRRRQQLMRAAAR